MDLDGGVIHNEGPPLQTPEKWISPHPNLYVKPHVNNRYIGNFIDKRQEFQGPPLPMPRVMDLARLKKITYRAI
jgi:hypothetical protein